MRNFLSLTASFMIILAAVPALSLFYKPDSRSQRTNSSQTQQTESEESNDQSTEKTAVSSTLPNKVRVLLHESGKIISVDRRFYIISVLAKEIDIHAPAQALMAQAVCIQTFLKRTSEALEDKDYDISDDPAVHQSFLTEKALKQFWGGAYKSNYKKLEHIVNQIGAEYLSYQGQTVLAAYHSSNAGKTESAKNYWGEDHPYLQAVDSIGDTLCTHYREQVVFKSKVFKQKLSQIKGKGFLFAASPSDWLGECSYTPSGTVSAISLAGVSLSGREVRQALGLKSSFFTVAYKNGCFVFTVSGYGHGVGLSQEGAKYMAKLGFSYREILMHYYKGVEIRGENAL